MLTGSFLPRVGGMEYAVHYLAQAMSKMGLDVVVFCHTPQGSIDFQPNYEIVRYGSSLPLSGRVGLDRYLCCHLFKKYHRSKKVDILHCHNVSYPGAIAVRIKKAFDLPLIMTPHGEDVQRFPEINYGMRLDPKWDKKVREHLMQADAVTAISQSILRDIDFVSRDKLYKIPNGVEVAKFSGPPTKFLHRLLGIKDDTKVIISVGRNHVKKGYAAGIAAFSSSRVYERENVKYAIIGSGVDALQDDVERFGVQDHLYLIPELPHDKIGECYRSASLFFSPSITEGLSLVSIEAMAAGLPILATDVPGNRDVVQENGCGMLVPANDIPAMASALKTLIANGRLRCSYAKKAVERRNRYSWGSIAKRYIDVYLTLLRDQPNPGARLASA